ncbi:MAG TPA: GNAT family N-acetyltransferase [Lacipirellulaceae bacterium]|nr:GNAT family N-acetyltransferase [Lacipirellulaceae bacterium]
MSIVRCPPELRGQAFAIVLCDLAPSQRREMASPLLSENAGGENSALESLFIALRGEQLCGAAWGQSQVGNVAVLWPPQLVSGEDFETAQLLARAAVDDLDAKGVDLTQSLLVAPDEQLVGLLKDAGFRHLADLVYLSCEAARFPLVAPDPCEVEFEEYRVDQRRRMADVMHRTYEGTLDCTALDGVRDMNDVIDGYMATGAFKAENWSFVRNGGHDVGVLILADHPGARHRELVYMGLVPEYRGRGWGRQVAHYAQWLTRGARLERLLVAVDVANKPAADIYRATGFEVWELREVYVRMRAKSR